MTDWERLKNLQRDCPNMPCEKFNSELKYLRGTELWCNDPAFFNLCEELLYGHMITCGDAAMYEDEGDAELEAELKAAGV